MNGKIEQWFTSLADGRHNFILPFSDWTCAFAPHQSGYTVGIYKIGTSPYTQFETTSNYSANRSDLIFIGY